MKLSVIHLASNADLPASVRDRVPSDDAQTVFRVAFNQHASEGRSEMNAYVKAWRALADAGYAENADQCWIKKDAPTASDVHVDKPIGAVLPRGRKRRSSDVPGDAQDFVKEDAVILDVPLFLRLLEYAREELKTDEPLHVIAERVVALAEKKPELDMSDFPKIVAELREKAPAEEVQKRISGNSSIGLNADGKKLANELGERIALKGGLDVLYCSTLERGRQTAAAIKAADANVHAAEPDSALCPWHLGEYEGQMPHDVKDYIRFYIEHPDRRPPGKGADGSAAETFEEAKKRQLDFWSRVYADSQAHPTLKIGVVDHSRGQELLQAWVDQGCPKDYGLKLKDLEHPDDPDHASMLRWHKDEIQEIDLEDDDELKPGVYPILHSLTDDDTDDGNEELEKGVRPPGLKAATDGKRCGSCGYFDDSGLGQCRMYDGWYVKADQVCDEYVAGKPNTMGDDVEKYSPDQPRDKDGKFGERPGGKGNANHKVGEKFTDNSGRKTTLMSVSSGGNINTDAFHQSVFSKDNAGVVPVAFNVEDSTLHFPNAGRHDADHANFASDVVGGKDPDLHTVRGNLDLTNRSLTLYDMKSEASTIASNSNMMEQRAVNVIDRNLGLAKQKIGSMYVNGRKIKVDTMDIGEALGFGKFEKGGPGSGPHPGQERKASHAALLNEHEQLFDHPVRLGHSLTGEANSTASEEEKQNYKTMLREHLAHVEEHGKKFGMPAEAKTHAAQASNKLMTAGHTAVGREASLMHLHNALRAFGHAIGKSSREATEGGGPVQKYLPPLEVLEAAQRAWEVGASVIDVTSSLAAGDGLGMEQLRRIDEYFASVAKGSVTPTDLERDAWGGPLAAKWAARVIKKFSPWIAVDFDGTLAEKVDDLGTVGAPREKEVVRVKADLAAGKTVKIFTARVADDPDGKQRKLIEAFCVEQFGRELEITNQKDPGMTELRDDLAVPILKGGNGVMLAFWLGEEVQNHFAVAGGEKPEELHVTLAYFGKLNEISADAIPIIERAVESFAASHGPVKVVLGGIGRFPATPQSDGRDVAYLGVHGDCQKFREELVAAVEALGVEPKKNFGWNPHVTLKLVPPHAPHLLPTPDPEDVVFDEVVLSIGSAKKSYKLTGVGKNEDSAEEQDESVGDDASEEDDRNVELKAEIIKLDDEKQLVFGWFSVVKVGTRLLKDTQEDIIHPDTIESSAYRFVLEARKGGEMHEHGGDGKIRGVGALVESVVFTKEKVEAMIKSLKEQGIDATIDLGCEAWWGGFKIQDSETWKKVKTGELRAWSIGGRGKREKAA